MALSQEVLDNLAFANQMGFDKMHLAPPVQTREMMKDRIYHSDNKEDETYKPLLEARNVKRYLLDLCQ